MILLLLEFLLRKSLIHIHYEIPEVSTGRNLPVTQMSMTSAE